MPVRVCHILRCHYKERVKAFLESPCKEWMKQLGYDEDYLKFSVACERWKQSVNRTAGNAFSLSALQDSDPGQDCKSNVRVGSSSKHER